MVGNKRGLSDIVTNVLIVLLVLVAVGIIWFFIQPFIRDGVSGITSDAYTINLGIQSRSVTDDGTNVTLIVKRGAGKGTLVGFNIIITDVNDNSKVVRRNIALNELETIIVSEDYRALGLGAVKSVAVVPIIADQEGKEQNGQQSAPESPSSNQTTSGGSCTNGAQQACLGAGGYPGTQTCTSGTWGSCLVTLSCGDGVKTTPPEVCEYNSTSSYYGSSCDYGALPEFSNPGFLFGNSTCTSSCTTNATCSCYVDFNHNGFISDGDDIDLWNTAYADTNHPLHSQTDCDHNGVINANDVACITFLFNDGTRCNYQGS